MGAAWPHLLNKQRRFYEGNSMETPMLWGALTVPGQGDGLCVMHRAQDLHYRVGANASGHGAAALDAGGEQLRATQCSIAVLLVEQSVSGFTVPGFTLTALCSLDQTITSGHLCGQAAKHQGHMSQTLQVIHKIVSIH